MESKVPAGTKDYQAQVAHDIKVIKGWVIFLGILAMIGVIYSIIIGVQLGDAASHISQIGCSNIMGC